MHDSQMVSDSCSIYEYTQIVIREMLYTYKIFYRLSIYHWKWINKI